MEENLRILKPYLRGLPLIALAMFIGLIIARKYLSYVTPMFESTAKLKLADIGEGVPNSNLFKDFDVFASSNKIAAEIEVLKSHVLIDKTLNELDFDMEMYRVGKIRTVELYHNSPFVVHIEAPVKKTYDRRFTLRVLSTTEYLLGMPDNGPWLHGLMGQTLDTPLGPITISLNDSLIAQRPELHVADHYEFELKSRQNLVASIAKQLDVIASDKDVAIIRISAKNANPEKAALLVNKLTEVYIEDYIETKYKAANVTVNFLENQINTVLVKLTSAEDHIQSFRDEEGITNINQETETDLRKISQLKILQTNIKMNLDAIQQLEQYIKQGQGRFLELAPNFEAFTDLLSTEIVKNMKALQAEKRDLLLVFTPEDERVKVIDQKLNDLVQYLIESISNTRRNLEIKYDNISNDIKLAEMAFIGVPEKEKMLTILNREFGIYQQSYNFLNEKKIEAEIAQAAKIAFHRVIAPAEISKQPVSPNKPIIMIVSAMLAMFGTILLIFIIHSIKAKVNDLVAIESNSAIPVAMLTARHKSGPESDKHFSREAIQLEIKGLVKPSGILCFTSFRQKEGAAYNALGLSNALLRQGRKLLFIDVENTLGRQSFAGIDRMSFSDESYAHYTLEKMKATLDAYRKSYDVVVVLNESLISNSKASLMMGAADVNFLVVDSRLTPLKRIAEVNLLKDDFQFPSMHFILNRFAYNPNVIIEIMQCAKRFINRLNTKKQS